ncbi:MAG: hypothetical protein ABI557_08305 [Aureliella sp.]
MWYKKRCWQLIGGLEVLVMRAQAHTVSALNKSESHNRQARSILDTLGSSSAKRLANIPAAESVRQDILAQTIAYYEHFIDSSNSDPLLQSDVAHTRLEIARLTALSSDYDTAEQAYRSVLPSLSNTTASPQDLLLLVQILNEWALLPCFARG